MHWQRNLFVCAFGSFTTIFSMTLVLPFLPVYVEQLGVAGHAQIIKWSSIAYSVAFFTAGLVAPLWGYLGDRYGRKTMLMRASLGMAIAISLMGAAQNIWQLAGLRMLVGLAGGYASGATILVAAQTPRDKSGWALGLLSSGVMFGNLAGPLVGGALPAIVGIRTIFEAAGFLIFIAFAATVLMIQKDAPTIHAKRQQIKWSEVPERSQIIALLIVGMLLMAANISIEPVITVFVGDLGIQASKVTFVAGLAMSATALGSALSGTFLGKIADRIGHARMIQISLGISALFLLPQMFVTRGWQLVALRLLLGLSLGALLPCLSAAIRHRVPDNLVGTVLGYSVSFQFAGQVAGPLLAAAVSNYVGLRAVFLMTSLLLFIGCVYTWVVFVRRPALRNA